LREKNTKLEPFLSRLEQNLSSRVRESRPRSQPNGLELAIYGVIRRLELCRQSGAGALAEAGMAAAASSGVRASDQAYEGVVVFPYMLADASMARRRR